MEDSALKSILESIKRYFGDTSRPAEATLDGLESLAEEIDSLIRALKEDAKAI